MQGQPEPLSQSEWRPDFGPKVGKANREPDGGAGANLKQQEAAEASEGLFFLPKLAKVASAHSMD
jgi:hypothetical protein